MKILQSKYIQPIFVCLLLICSVCVHASTMQKSKVYTIQDVPYTQKKNKLHFVSDPEHYLSNSTINQVNEMCHSIRQKSGAEVAVVILPWIDPADCFEFAHDLFHYWGIGQKGVDTGLLILITTEERCAHIYTGYGLEGVLTDVTTGNIFRNEMVPFLKNKEWDQGILAGVSQFYKLLYNNQDYEHIKTQPARDDSVGYLPLILFGFFFIFITSIVIISRKQRKCPKCGKLTLQRINSHEVHRTSNYILIEETLRCTNCGNKVVRKKRIARNNNHTGPSAGPIFGGGFGGSRGGGFGGGFGGGRGGGGGAGGRF